jgi:hypothetical protein
LELKNVGQAVRAREDVKGVVDWDTCRKPAMKLLQILMHHHLHLQRRRE